MPQTPPLEAYFHSYRKTIISGTRLHSSQSSSKAPRSITQPPTKNSWPSRNALHSGATIWREANILLKYGLITTTFKDLCGNLESTADKLDGLFTLHPTTL